MGVMQRILRVGEGKKLRALESLVPDINAVEPAIQKLTDEQLRARTDDFRNQLANGADLNDLLIETFAVAREAAQRVIGQRHYDVQLMGGMALHFGWVAEMKTGEGKTLVSTLPVYLNALSGKGVHVVTANEYLASRDAEWMGHIHRFLGLEVGLVVPGNADTVNKREQYAADVTYGTNNEFGFDYLRDNMAPESELQVQRGHSYCIVDEVDSILIDEARTPLIISGRIADVARMYERFAAIARSMNRDTDYEVEEDKRNVAILEPGIEKVEQALDIENLYDQNSASLVPQLSAALRAKELYKRDKDYVVQNGEVKIVDEFTGRILDGRRWSEGLHQAIEAKEGVKIKEENQTLATVTLQNYFKLYDKLAGMTGTAETEAAEFGNTYGLDVVPIPTNRPLNRASHSDLIYKTEASKFEAVVDDISERSANGQPVLVGTISVEKSERLSRALEQRGVKHHVLNAKEHHREAEIITQAGQIGAVTVATNMAGRGVDILLGGNPEGLARHDLIVDKRDPDDPANAEDLAALASKYEQECEEQKAEVLKLGGLFVLGTERHESRRIDNQLRGRSGRQGDPGESRFYLSLEDDLMRMFATTAMNWVMDKSLPDDVPLEAKMVTKAIERAQNNVEQRNAESRKNVLKYDNVMNEQRKVMYSRRKQILSGIDLREAALEYLTEAVTDLVDEYCSSEHASEWDLDGLLVGIHEYWPTQLTAEQLAQRSSANANDANEIEALLLEDGQKHYEAREVELGPELMRTAERQVLLGLLDQRWRDHLSAMDHLRDGIHLRGIGQKDPVAEWQREGFDMFSEMLKHTYQDFVKHIMHVELTKPEQTKKPNQKQAKQAEPSASQLQYSAPDGTSSGGGTAQPAQPGAQQPSVNQQGSRQQVLAGARSGGPAGGGSALQQAATRGATRSAGSTTTVTARPKNIETGRKLGRNDPCHCGSGRKLKHCHGR